MASGALATAPCGTRVGVGVFSARATSERSCSSPSVLRGNGGQVLLVLAAGSRLSAYIGATVGEIGFLRGFWLEGSRRLAWLEDYAHALVEQADAPVAGAADSRHPARARFFHLSGQPRAGRWKTSISTLPAGSVVAIVGENGAGKSTLVKLLCRMYQPDAGRILVDGVDLARMPAEQWRSRLAGAFQDFFRFEFQARHTVGLGDVPRLENQPAVAEAVDARRRRRCGRATQRRASTPNSVQPGRGGVEVSFGQWQKLALSPRIHARLTRCC